MILKDLLSELTRLAETYGDHYEVRIASQPSWPFENYISMVTCREEDDEGMEPGIVYIAEGDQIRCLPEEVDNDLKGRGW